MRVKIFIEWNTEILEEMVNGWISSNGLGPKDIIRVNQSSAIDSEGVVLVTISIWYTPAI